MCDSAERFEYRNVVHWSESHTFLTYAPALSKGMNPDPIGVLGGGSGVCWGVGVARETGSLSKAPWEDFFFPSELRNGIECAC